MVRVQKYKYSRRYSNPYIIVRQTVKDGIRIKPAIKKRKKRPLRSFVLGVFNLIKIGLFVGAAFCPITCVFVVGWMLLE